MEAQAKFPLEFTQAANTVDLNPRLADSRTELSVFVLFGNRILPFLEASPGYAHGTIPVPGQGSNPGLLHAKCVLSPFSSLRRPEMSF